MPRKKAGHVFLGTIDRPATSLSPDDMKVPAPDPKQVVAERGLQALTRSMSGTGQKAPMPRSRRPLFRQNYYKGTLAHPDMLQGDPFGTTTRREETTGSQARGG